MKKRLAFIALLFSFFTTASAQYVTSGKVIDHLGNPISGAKVQGIGTSKFTETGIDGSFSLDTPIKISEIEVNSIGKLTTIKKKEGEYTVVTMKNPTWWNMEPERCHWFVMAQVNITSGSVPIGGMVGMVKHWGFYVRGVFSGMPSTVGEYESGAFYGTNKKKTGFMAITAGGIYRFKNTPLHIYAGLGYANKKEALEHNSGIYVKNKNESFKSLACDLGLMIDIKNVMFNVGYAMCPKDFSSINIQFGIGYKF